MSPPRPEEHPDARSPLFDRATAWLDRVPGGSVTGQVIRAGVLVVAMIMLIVARLDDAPLGPHLAAWADRLIVAVPLLGLLVLWDGIVVARRLMGLPAPDRRR